MFEIPEDRLPPGFADTVVNPPARPAEAVPAATVVLMRDGTGGPEVLLMRRHHSSGFVPGAWVFPGGRVDEADADPRLRERIRGLPEDADPGLAYWAAALREAFEETGVLLARTTDGWVADARDPRVEAVRRSLMDDEATLLDVLDALDVALDAEGMVHAAHWVTPVVEPRRYDTRFFIASVEPGTEVIADPREMVDAAWLTPQEALSRFRAGDLPMVFPTVRTLEDLVGFPSAAAAVDAARNKPVRPRLPRLVKTPTGVAIRLPGDGSD